MIDSVIATLKKRPQGAKILAVEDFNMKLSEPEGYRRGEETAAALTTEGLEDMSAHFLPFWRSWCRDRRTWNMVRAGREVKYRTDYIMGTDRCLFCNVCQDNNIATKPSSRDDSLVARFLYWQPCYMNQICIQTDMVRLYAPDLGSLIPSYFPPGIPLPTIHTTSVSSSTRNDSVMTQLTYQTKQLQGI